MTLVPQLGHQQNYQDSPSPLTLDSACSFGTNNSAIGLVSTLSLDDRPIAWQDEGLVIQSPSPLANFNAIDAAVLNDPQVRV